MIAVAIPRCEASVIDDGQGRVRLRRGGGRRMHVMPIGRADPSLFRAANRLRHGITVTVHSIDSL
jgi:hypothetical protein